MIVPAKLQVFPGTGSDVGLIRFLDRLVAFLSADVVRFGAAAIDHLSA